MHFKIGIDVGGTFTDLVAVNDGGDFCLAKTPSTPGQEAAGVMKGLEKVAAHFELPLQEFLAATSLIIHGTTVATNTMIQYNGARTGLLATQGFRDEIEIRRGIKESMFDVKLDKPQPIAPRRQRLGVVERVDSQGQIVTALDEGQAREAIRSLKAMDVEAIAVCFLFSFLNPGHEQRVLQLIQEEYPAAYACISSDILPQIREFERASTTVVNAYVGPKLKSYLIRLRTLLREMGFAGRLFVMQSNGGMAAIENAGERGVYALFSGPAGGIAAATFLGALTGYRDLITVDMGGTSYDVCLIRDGRPAMGTENWVSRYRVAVPMIDVHTLGAGGGSIAWIDPGGALRVGPASAGADPGPACYGRGGREPTVTDADLVLGYLDAGSFANGEFNLDQALAEQAIAERVAQPLGMSVVEAAHAIFRIVNSNMVNGIRVVSVQRGYDPRDFSLMAFGGAGAVHAGVQAAELSIPRIIVPRAASTLCALGDLIADVKMTEVRTFISPLTATALEPMWATFETMARRAKAQLPGDSIQETAVEYFADLRYAGEVHEITVPLPPADNPDRPEYVDRLAEAFHALHEQLYAYRDLENPIEIINLRVDAIGRTWKPQLQPKPLAGGDPAAAYQGSRPVFFGELDGFAPTPVYDGVRLRPGDRLSGPCIIQEPWMTVVVRPGQVAALDAFDHYVIHLATAASGNGVSAT